MNKQQAIEAIEQGKKIRHTCFTDDEWVTKGEILDYAFENGCECRASEFWHYRQDDAWDDGWEVVND